MHSTRRIYLYFFVMILTLLFSPILFSQSGIISGKIVNSEDQAPLSNVNIVLLNKSMKTSTNSEGTYELINIPAGAYTLQASCVGFKTYRSAVTVGDTKVTMDIQLKLEPIGMNEVVISGYRESYTTGDNYSASRINAPMMTLPLSTGQITNKLLADQNIINVNDALKNISGVVSEFGGPHPLIVNIRGFNASIFKDGFRVGGCNNMSPGGDDLPISVVAVDRIEVLKGPSAILYGRGEPGGIVNFISKQPQAEPGYNIETMTGSFQQYRIGGSATGPLLNESVSYRLDGSYEKSNSYRDLVKTKTYFIKPSFALHLSEKTKVYLTGEISESDFTPDRGVLMLPSMDSNGKLTASLAPISSRSYNFGEASDNTNQKQQRAVVEVEHMLTPDWTVRVAANYEQAKQQSTYVWDWFYTYQGSIPPGFPPVDQNGNPTFPPNWTVRPINTIDSKRTDVGGRIENYFRVSHSLFGTDVVHGILAVVDFLQIDTKYYLDYNPFGLLDPATGNRINMVIPIYPHEEMLANSKDFGIAVQDLITIDKRWHILLGGRLERNTVDANQLAAFNTIPNTTYNKSTGFAPRFGILYQVQENISLFASYMGSFQSPGADYGLWDIPADLKPERSYQTEAGAKFEMFEKRILLTTSVFTINKYDVISSERNPLGVSPYLLYFNIGKEDAQGLDIDIVGEVTPNLRISAAGNTQTMKFTSPKKIIVDGKMRYGTPTYSGNLWAVYEFSDGMLNGLGVGGGASTRSSVFVNDANEASVPAYTTVDAIAYYQFANLRVQFNLYNITNELAYTVSNIGGFGDPTYPFLVMPIAPFRMNFTVRYEY